MCRPHKLRTLHLQARAFSNFIIFIKELARLAVRLRALRDIVKAEQEREAASFSGELGEHDSVAISASNASGGDENSISQVAQVAKALKRIASSEAKDALESLESVMIQAFNTLVGRGRYSRNPKEIAERIDGAVEALDQAIFKQR